MEVNVRVQVVQNVIIRFRHLSTMKSGELVKSHHFKTSEVSAPPAPEVLLEYRLYHLSEALESPP